MERHRNAQYAPVLQDDSQTPSETPGGFISYISSFPSELTPKKSGFYSLGQLARQVEAARERDKTCTECRALAFQLMATTAHDSNNLLTILLGQIEILLMKVSDPKLREGIEAMRPTAQRLAELNREMLKTARQGFTPEAGPIDTAEVILKIVPLCLLNSGIRAECDLDGVGHIKTSPILFSQAFQNLVINARQAMPQGGFIRICSADIEDMEGKKWLEIRVVDQGCGIPEDRLPHVFDMFFTTKDEGHGLGLAFVKTFVRQLGGEITVRSTVGQGTTFILRLPTC